MHLAEAADADGLAQVYVAGDGGGPDVEPVLGLGGEFVGVGGFHCVDPACFQNERIWLVLGFLVVFFGADVDVEVYFCHSVISSSV